MIKTTELRIGNLFSDEYKTPCYFAGAWQRKDGWISRDSADNTYKDMQMYPIELTAEILENCGFVFTGNWFDKKIINGNVDYQGTHLHVSIEHKSFCIMNTGTLDNVLIGKQVKYLHQLQNLFFALTGEELPVQDLSQIPA